MSKKNHELLIDLGPFDKPVLPKDNGKPQPAKRSRFAQLPIHVIKYCCSTGNAGLLGVLSYLAMNCYNTEWRYNVSGICNAIGLKRHCVTKWIKKLEALGVLKPVNNEGYVKCYTLDIDRHMELFDHESDLSFMSIESTQMSIQSTSDDPKTMSIESPTMSIQSTGLSIETTPDVDSIAINRIEIENVKKKGIIEGDQPFFTNARCRSHYPDIESVSLHQSGTVNEPTEMYESDDFNEPTEVYESMSNSSPPLSPVPSSLPKPTTVSQLVKLHGRALERELEQEKIQKEREQEQERRNKRYADFIVRQNRYASHLEYLEEKSDISPADKANCLREALISLKRAGCFQPERGYRYDAPVIVDNRGVDLAEKFFEANPSIDVACVMDIIHQLVERIRFDDDSTDSWDACQLEKKCLKLSYFFNYMEEIVTKNDFFGLPTVTHYVTDIQPKSKPIYVKEAA